MRRLRILLVEDNAGDADLVREYLSQARQALFEVECVPRLESALARLERDPCDLIILDLGLPDSSGLETLTRVVAASPRTAIVVLTGLDDDLTGMEAVRLGAQDYLPKARLAPDLLIRTVLHSVERKRAQEELKQSQELLSLALEGANLGEWNWDLTTGKALWSERNHRLLGYEPHEVEPNLKNWKRLVHRDDWPRVSENLNLHMQGRLPMFEIEYRILNKSGRWQWVQAWGKIVEFDAGGKPTRMSGVLSDITERKKAEDELRRQAAVLTAVLNSPHETVALLDTKGTVLRINTKGAERFGMLPEEMVGKNIYSLIPEPGSGNRRRIIEEVMRTGQPAHFEDRRDNTEYMNSVYPLLDPQSTDLLGVTIFASDITERKRSEAERGRLMAAIEQAGETIVVTDTEGTITYVNPAFEKVTGYARMEAVGENPRLLKSGEHDREFYKQLWNTIKGGRVWSGRFVNKRKDGRLYHEEATISPVKDASGEIVNFVAVKRDITENLELSKQLQQAQKMEAIGTLAGGVAHDFNNVLQVVLGYSELLLSEEQFPRKLREDLAKIHLAARNGADLVQQLLTFSRKTEVKPLHLDLNGRIKQLQKMLSRTISKTIEMELVLMDDLWSVNADPTQVDQVLMNLAVNARDAMPEGGKLIIETKNVTLGEDYSRAHLGAKPGSYVLLSMSDTGQGMDKETQQHIFEPFFTTKGPGEGTGLGLATVYGIVTQHDGYVTCYSEPGLGTTFRLYFPAVISDDQPIETHPRALPRGGSETILLVDDEEFVRDLGSRILTKAGYKVMTAPNGKKALEIYQTDADKIALVILDLIMPEMGGKQCLEALLNLDPAPKVVIASGFSADGPTKEALAAGAKGFVNKPYNIHQILEVVREVLDAD